MMESRTEKGGVRKIEKVDMLQIDMSLGPP